MMTRRHGDPARLGDGARRSPVVRRQVEPDSRRAGARYAIEPRRLRMPQWIARRAESRQAVIPGEMLQRACALFGELAASQGNRKLLHGDLHRMGAGRRDRSGARDGDGSRNMAAALVLVVFQFADVVLGVELEAELGDQVELRLEEVDMP